MHKTHDPQAAAPTNDSAVRRLLREIRQPCHLVVLAWIAFCAANLALRDRWGAWLVVGVLPWSAWLIVGVVLLLVLWWRSACTPVLVSLTVVSVLATGLSSGTPVSRAHLVAPAPADIRVVQWNTQFWDDGEEPSTFARQLQDQHADVYILQEHGTPGPGNTITGRTSLTDVHDWFPGFHVATYQDLITISRYPITDQSHDPAGGALSTTLATPTGSLRVVNVHTVAPYDLSYLPIAPSFWSSVTDRSRTQDRQLDWASSQVVDSTPVLVAGDFNATGGMRSMSHRFPGLRDLSTNPWHGTWGIYGVLAWRLDWQLASSSVCVSNFRILPNNSSSDHSPTEMTLRTQQGGRSC